MVLEYRALTQKLSSATFPQSMFNIINARLNTLSVGSEASLGQIACAIPSASVSPNPGRKFASALDILATSRSAATRVTRQGAAVILLLNADEAFIQPDSHCTHTAATFSGKIISGHVKVLMLLDRKSVV